MEEFSRNELKLLIAKQQGLCISIFLPTRRTGAEVQQNQIRLRKLLREAEAKLIADNCSPQKARSLLEPAIGLLGNAIFWKHQRDGLAIFLSANLFRYYRLPTNFDELIVVTDRFYVETLLPVFTGDDRFYILTLSQNENRLFECTKHSIKEVENKAVPQSLAEALHYDEPEKQIRFHTGASRGGQRSSMISGHGAELDDTKENLLKYFRLIDKGLHDILKDEHIPLVLAGVDYIFPIYRETNTYPHLIEEGITGNPKGMTAEQLHKHAWTIVNPYFQKAENNAVAQYKQSSGTGLTSSDIKEIISAAYHGRIGLLFIKKGYQQWGFFDPLGNDVQPRQKMEKDSERLTDYAAIQTYLNGGAVYVLAHEEMPDDAPVSAVFRY